MATLQTAVGKKDAIETDLGNNDLNDVSPKLAGGDGIESSIVTSGVTTTSEKVVPGVVDAAASDSDDLLEKIEEAVSAVEPNGSAIVAADSVIAESSEQDFIKKLEEAEAEVEVKDGAGSAAGLCDQATKVIEENVSSSDDTDKVVVLSDSDELDKVASLDNVVDSTSIELGGKAVDGKAPITAASAKDSEATVLISSEDEENGAVSAAKVVESSPRASRNTFSADDISETGDDVAQLGKDSVENGEAKEAISDVVTLDDEEASDPVAKKPKLDDNVAKQQPVESVDLCLDDEDDECEEVKESTVVVEKQPKAVQDSTAKEVSQSDKISASADELPMSTDPSPQAETMDVDDEEKMDVDAVESISDNEAEMTPITEVTKDTIVKSKTTEKVPPNSETVDTTVEAAPAVEKRTVEAVIEIEKTSEADAKVVDTPPEKKSKTVSGETVQKIVAPAEEGSQPTGVTEKTLAPRPENKLLDAIKHIDNTTSVENSPVGTPSGTVFNSTPIQKQFEISSENVSKISEVHDEVSRTTEDTTAQSSKAEEESTETESSQTTTQTSADSATKFLNVIKEQCNGTSEESDIVRTTSQKSPAQSKSTAVEFAGVSSSSSSIKDTTTYDINVWYEADDIRYLSIERTSDTHANASESLEKMSSNGSVTSLPPFVLPNRVSEMLSGSSSGGEQKTLDSTKPSVPATKRTKHSIVGKMDLCKFMIDIFTKLRGDNEEDAEEMAASTTPKGRGRGSTKKSTGRKHADEEETPKKSLSSTTKRGQKRKGGDETDDDDDDDDDEEESKSTQSGKHASSKSPAAVVDDNLQCVLAKWVDRKYYAGKITDEKSGNKFVVLFEDGASKVLPKDSIVFGEGDRLPLQDQSVYALVDDDYELAVVKAIAKPEGEKTVRYTVEIKGKEIIVGASDLYLTEQQAKTIQKSQDSESHGGSSNAESKSAENTPSTAASRSTRKRQATSPLTPEAGFSGGLPKRGAGRRQKRTRQELDRISESTDLSDSPEAPRPPSIESPDSDALEIIEGVQPESQRTSKESEICQMILISDQIALNPAFDIAMLLGPMPISKSLFKNKSFLLTCTVRLKLPKFNSNSVTSTNGASVTPNSGFCATPFIKKYLQEQIEAGGGKVYKHFEDIPKSKYRQCKLIAANPCLTAKYIQCLAADIHAVSLDWITDSCNANTVAQVKCYHLPSGWSIVDQKYIRWTVGKSSDCRQNSKPFQNEIILIASENQDFVKFWSRVCRMADARLRFVKTLNDITPTTRGYMLTDMDFPQTIKSKAEHYGIPIVSTTWVVQSLIVGRVWDPNSHSKFTNLCTDDEFY